MSDAVLHQVDGPVHQICFNRPQALNAIDRALAAAFLDACRAVVADDTARVLVIRGAGRGFMAGGDIAQFRDDPASVAPTLIAPMHEALTLLAQAPVPVVAALHGPVAGAGLSLALACDLAIAADDVRLAFAYPQLGASCDLGASWHLPRLVGLRRALEIALLSPTLNAQQALEWGLVNQVVPAEELERTVQSVAERLAGSASHALGELKQLLRHSDRRDFPDQLQAEQDAFGRCMDTADFREGVAAFLEKRRPTFSGR